uniref:Uncharacterized protein n=1 Tax=Sphaerodactylus townsendi TaxID=933632 RepID=A0ACB8F396_9SAUR
MKTLMRHGLAVSLALTTMCTSLLLMYGSIGGGGGGSGGGQKEQSQQQVAAAAATASVKPPSPRPPGGSGQRRLPGFPARPLEGYISVLDHKVSQAALEAAGQGDWLGT